MTAFKQSGGSSGPTGNAGGDLAGTYPNPTVKNNAITEAKIVAQTITDASIAAGNKDGVAGALSLRTLGTGAQQAAPGNDTRFLPSPSGNNGKTVLVAGNAYTLALPKVPGRVFYVSQYSPFNDLVNSDTPAIQAAINACVSAGGGIVFLDAIDYYLNTSGVFGLTHPADLGFQITIMGLGMDATNVRLGARNKTFLVGDTSYTDNTHTYKNLTVQDLTVNGRNANGTDNPSRGLYGAVYGSQGRCNYENLQFRRIRTVSMGPNVTVGAASSDGLSTALITQERRNIDITVSTTPEGLLGANQFTVKDIIVEDCNFGYSGGGGNVGVSITAFHGDPTNAARKPNFMYNAPYLSNSVFTNIRISRCKHDTGVVSTLANNNTLGALIANGQGIAGINFMIGQACQGSNWVIEDCIGANSADVGIEVDSGLNTVVRNCVITDSYNESYYHANIGGGADTYGYSNPKQHQMFVNCRSYHHAATDGPSQAFLIFQPKFASAFGHVSLIDCEATREPNGTWPVAGSSITEFRGNFRSINIRNHHVSETFSTSDTTAAVANALLITAMGGQCVININGLHDDMTGTTTSGSTTNTFTRSAFAVHGVDLTLDIRDITYIHRWRSGNGHRLKSVGATLSPSTDFSDGFPNNNGNWSTRFDYILDAGGGVTGAPTDISQSSGFLASAANPTVEQRFLQVMASANGSWVNVGPFTDQSHSIKSTPGATISGHKTGIILKRRLEDPTYYLECSVSDNGTSSFLKIDKVLAGSRTNLATSSALTTRISNGVAYWVRGYIKGNVITADYFTSAPGTIATSGEETLTFTLLTTDIEKLGDSRQGWGGFSWIPMDAAAILDDHAFKRIWVSGGAGFSNISPAEISGPATQAYGFSEAFGPSAWRVRRPLQLRSCDFTALAGNTNVTDVRFADGDTAFQQYTDAQDINYAVPPAAAAVTPPGSTVAYTNTTGRRERHFISGGTVSAATLTDVNGTATAVPTAFSGILNSGEALTLTYTIAPTLWNKVPVL